MGLWCQNIFAAAAAMQLSLLRVVVDNIFQNPLEFYRSNSFEKVPKETSNKKYHPEKIENLLHILLLSWGWKIVSLTQPVFENLPKLSSWIVMHCFIKVGDHSNGNGLWQL